MRWLILFAAAGCADDPTGLVLPTEPTDSTPPSGTVPPPTGGTETTTTPTSYVGCEPLAGLTVLDFDVTQPWLEHEARAALTLSAPAAVAVACKLEGDDAEVHLVEGTKATTHSLRMAGLLAGSTYRCQAAPVCPTSSEPPAEVLLKTGVESNALLPELVVTVHEPEASPDYVVANHQNSGAWNGQRRLVIDRDGHVRWHAIEAAGGGAGGSAFTYSVENGAFTIGGGWPPNDTGRPQVLAMYGSGVLDDALLFLPDGDTLLFHHEARQLADGRLLSLEQHTVDESDGGTLDGFGVHIVDPDIGTVDFTYLSQRGYDEGHLPGGSGDAYHANWADVVDDVLHLSLCGIEEIVAIDANSGDWRWTFGAGGDFTLVDTDGNALGDEEYPQCQHGVRRLGDKLLVYDNGKLRGYSRAVEYQLDEVNQVATKLWDWTEPDWYETSLGGVDYTSGGGVLVAMGHIEIATPSPGDQTTFVEIDPETGDKLWELKYGDSQDVAFRGQSVAPCDLFANAKYCAEAQVRLQQLDSLFVW